MPTEAAPPPPFAKGLEGVIAAQTRASFVDGTQGRLIYRGIPIEELGEHSTYEETAYFLLYGELPKRAALEAFQARLAERRALPAEILSLLRSFPRDAHPMALLRTAVSALGHFDPRADDTSREAVLEKSLGLVARFPTIVGAVQRIRRGREPVPPDPKLGHAANFLHMINGERPDDYTARVMDVALILHADHGLNASTFTSIVVVSSLTDIYSAITAAVGSLKGPLHGGANEQVMLMLQEIGEVSKAEPYIRRAIAEKRKVPGFGHRVYKTYDPRSRILGQYSRRLAEIKKDMRWYEMSRIIEEIMIKELGAPKGIFPNVDFYSASVYTYMGIEASLFTPIFAVSRIAGWCAHVLEQLEDNRIFRPRSLYQGPQEAHYIPLERR